METVGIRTCPTHHIFNGFPPLMSFHGAQKNETDRHARFPVRAARGHLAGVVSTFRSGMNRYRCSAPSSSSGRSTPWSRRPRFVCDDGTVLMDSSLLIDYAEVSAGRSLMPSEFAARQRALRIIGLGAGRLRKRRCRMSTSTTCARPRSSTSPGWTAWTGNLPGPMHCWRRKWRRAPCRLMPAR